MRIAGFLKRNPTTEPLPREAAHRGSRAYAAQGCLAGCLFAILLWIVPIPVVIVVWIFALNGPFGDYMLMAIPYFVALPAIGAAIGALYGRGPLVRPRKDG